MKKFFRVVVEDSQPYGCYSGYNGDDASDESTVVVAEDADEAEKQFVADLATEYESTRISKNEAGYWLIEGLMAEFKLSVKEIPVENVNKEES
jgi:hypothetical protein